MIPEEEGGGPDTPGDAPGEAEEGSLPEDEEANGKLGKAKGLEDGVFTYPTPGHEEEGIGHQPHYGNDRTQAQPAGEADDLDEVLGRLSEKGFFWPGVGRFGVGGEEFIDGGRHLIEMLLRVHFDIELGDGSQTCAGGLLEKGQGDVGHVVFLCSGRADDASNMDSDADGFEGVAWLEAAAGGKLLADQGGVVAALPLLQGPGDDFKIATLGGKGICGDASESDDIQAGPAIVHHNLDGDNLPHPGHPADGGGVVLGQAGSGRTKPVLAVDDQGGVARRFDGGGSQPVLGRFDGGKKEHAGGYPSHGEEGTGAVAGQLLER